MPVFFRKPSTATSKHSSSTKIAQLRLKREITALTATLIEHAKKEATQNRRATSQKLNKRLLELKRQHREVLQSIKIHSPEYASMKAVAPQTLEEIQTLLPGDGKTVPAAYYTTDSAVYLWLLDGKNIYPYKIDIGREALKEKILGYRTLLINPSIGVEELKGRAQELYTLLFKPLEAHIDLKAPPIIGVIPITGPPSSSSAITGNGK